MMYERARNLEGDGESRCRFLRVLVSYRNLQRSQRSSPQLAALATFAKGPTSRTRVVPRWAVMAAQLGSSVSPYAPGAGNAALEWEVARATHYIAWCFGQPDPVAGFLALETLMKIQDQQVSRTRAGSRSASLDALTGYVPSQGERDHLGMLRDMRTLNVLAGGSHPSPESAIKSIAQAVQDDGSGFMSPYNLHRQQALERWVKSEILAMFGATVSEC